MKSKFIVLIPAFNEEKNLPNVIQQLGTIFNLDQLILADDGSTDNSIEIARRIGIRVIRNSINRGKGDILRKGFEVILQRFPSVNWIITFDADGQHDYSDISRIFQTLQSESSIGIIVGKRNYTQMPRFNWISNVLTSNWCKYWLNWNISDLQCGFRCYSAEALQRILSYGLSKTKFDLETEILLVAWILNIEIVEIPIKTVYIGNHRKSRITPLIDTFRWILLILQFGFSLDFIKEMWSRKRLR